MYGLLTEILVVPRQSLVGGGLSTRGEDKSDVKGDVR